MRAKIKSSEDTGPKLAQLDIGYRSQAWSERKPSDVFIVPSADTGEGTKVFLDMLETGRNDNLQNLWRVTLAARKERKSARLVGLFIAIMEAQDKGGQADADWLKKLETLKKQQEVYEKYPKLRDVTDLLVQKFEQCRKLCLSLHEKQQQYGSAMTKDPKALQFLAVSMQCIDQVWLEVQGLMGLQKEYHEGIQEAGRFDFQFMDKDDEANANVRKVGNIQGLNLDDGETDQDDVEIYNEEGTKILGVVSDALAQSRLAGIEEIFKKAKLNGGHDIREVSSEEETEDEDDLGPTTLEEVPTRSSDNLTLSVDDGEGDSSELENKPTRPSVGDDSETLERIRSAE